jgi:hypothetical protein
MEESYQDLTIANLARSSRVHCATFGSFTGENNSSAVVSCGEYLAVFNLSTFSSTDAAPNNIDVSSATCVYHTNEFGSIRILSTLPSMSRDCVLAVNSSQQWWILGWIQQQEDEECDAVILSNGCFTRPCSHELDHTPVLLRGKPTCTVSPPSINASGTHNVLVVLLQLWTDDINKQDGNVLDALLVYDPLVNNETSFTKNSWKVDWKRISLNSSIDKKIRANVLSLELCQLAEISFTGKTRLKKKHQQTQQIHEENQSGFSDKKSEGDEAKDDGEKKNNDTKDENVLVFEYGVVILLNERSKLPGAPSIKHVNLAYLDVNIGAIDTSGGEFGIHAIDPSTSNVFVLNEIDALLCVEHSGCVLWTKNGCVAHQKISNSESLNSVENATHVIQKNGAADCMHVILLTSSGYLAHLTVHHTRHSNTYTLSPIVILYTKQVELVGNSTLACTSSECSLVVAAQGYGGLLQLIQISLSSEDCANITEQQALDVTGTEGCGIVAAATVVPLQRHNQDLSTWNTDDGVALLSHQQQIPSFELAISSSNMSLQSAEMRSLVVAAQQNKTTGALLNGHYGYGMQVLAEIGGEMELGSPEIFAVNIMSEDIHGEQYGFVLLLFSYLIEQQSQVLCMSKPGIFEAMDLSLMNLNENSSTLAFGYDCSFNHIIQIAPSGIYAGKLRLSRTGKPEYNCSNSTSLLWKVPKSKIAEHAVINDTNQSSISSSVNEVMCCLATQEEVYILSILEKSICMFTRISTLQPISALTLSGKYLAFAFWETGEIKVYHQLSFNKESKREYNAPFSPCDCEMLCKSLSVTSRASGIRALKFSADHGVSAPQFLACGTGDGHLICWDTRIFLKPESLYSMPVGVFVVGSSPVHYLEWSNSYGFTAISGPRGLVIRPLPNEHHNESDDPENLQKSQNHKKASIGECDVTRVHSSVLQSHRAMCHIFTGPRDNCAATSGTTTSKTGTNNNRTDTLLHEEEESLSLYAVVTSVGGLALMELDSNKSMRWDRHQMEGVPKHIAFHNATDIIVVSAVLSNGCEVLRIHNAEDLQLLRTIKMRPDQHISVVDTIVLNGREFIVLVAAIVEDENNNLFPPVAGRDIDHVESSSTLSLIIPVRNKTTEGISLSVANTMKFEGSSTSLCAFGTDSMALAVDNRVLLLKIDSTENKSLKVVAGLASPNGGAVISISQVEKNTLMLGEMAGAIALFVLDHNGKFQMAGQDKMLKQGVCSRMCSQKNSISCTSKKRLFSDWATNTIYSLDATDYKNLQSKELLRLESHIVDIFNGSLLPLSVEDDVHQQENHYIIISRDGSVELMHL